MKPVIRNVLLALGLLPMSVFADSSEESYEGQTNITGAYGYNNTSYGEIDLWQPFWQNAESVVFGDVRASKGNSNTWVSSVGGGYRWLAFGQQFLFSTYSFYDYKNTTNNNGFQQFTFGAELRTVDWVGRGNYYLPISAGNERIYNTSSHEYSFNGFNVEVGRYIQQIPGLLAYAGMFYYTSDEVNKTFVGPRLSAQYDLAKIKGNPLFNWANGWVKNFKIQGTWQYDDVRYNLWNIGVQLSIPFSNKPEPSVGVESHMEDYIRRDQGITTAK